MCIRKGGNVMGIEESDKWFETFVNLGIVKLASCRCLGSNWKSWNCWVKNVYHRTVMCNMYISWNRGHKNSIALSRDPAVR
jgi:hypothetical protein